MRGGRALVTTPNRSLEAFPFGLLNCVWLIRDKRLVYGKTSAIYAAGFLLYLRQGALMAEAFDPEQGRLKDGPPHRVADGVTLNYYHNNFDASESGMLVYRVNGEANEKRLTWFDRTGKNLGVTGEAADYWDVRLSPDGQKLASNSGSPNSEIWVDDLARALRMRLTLDPANDHGDPVWSPDGNRIAFAVWGKGIFEKNDNGAGPEELLLSAPKGSIWPTSWSRDSRSILYSRAKKFLIQAAACNLALLMRSTYGSGKPRSAHDAVIDAILTILAVMGAVEGHFSSWSVDSDKRFEIFADQSGSQFFSISPKMVGLDRDQIRKPSVHALTPGRRRAQQITGN